MAIEESQRSTLRTSDNDDEVSLLEILDHVLNTGVMIQGSIVISIAGVDLVYVALSAVLTSVETALRHLGDGATSRQERIARE